jgi:hypothetical protein
VTDLPIGICNHEPSLVAELPRIFLGRSAKLFSGHFRIVPSPRASGGKASLASLLGLLLTRGFSVHAILAAP